MVRLALIAYGIAAVVGGMVAVTLQYWSEAIGGISTRAITCSFSGGFLDELSAATADASRDDGP